jgi:hypothetical protein
VTYSKNSLLQLEATGRRYRVTATERTKSFGRRQQLLEDRNRYWKKAPATGRRQQQLEGNSYWKKAKATGRRQKLLEEG